MLAFLVTLTGCSTFNRQWERAAAVNAPKDDIMGRWEGSWLSDKNGHTGSLRCIVKKLNENQYEFQYKAVYWKIFRYSYTVNMAVQKEEAGHRFQGEENLGKLAGGVYAYEGKIEGSQFDATYRCKYDHGTFKMRRLAQ
ncbi:MAG: hypothetical protein AB1705_13940 [Verrucomicrobiota bacterium]